MYYSVVHKGYEICVDFIAITILALLIAALLIIKKKSPKTFDFMLDWVESSLSGYILDVLTTVAVFFFLYICVVRMITPFLEGDKFMDLLLRPFGNFISY